MPRAVKAWHRFQRSGVQAYLNSGLVEWWTHKHAITSPNPSPRVGEFIRMKVDFVNVLVCKVGSTTNHLLAC